MVRVRFAPSPTGFLHIGSARSALFNWLFARHENGKFLLRIEDTDRARSKDEYLNEIMESLKWLGMETDEELVFQSKRLDIYKDAADRLINDGKAYREGDAVRIKKCEEKIRVQDLSRGEIEFDPEILKDEVLIKSDGTPTYNFACVIDDADMKITHVIRGDDHISNTPKQIMIYEALGLEVPKFAHIPLIMGPDGGRLSKRHGATSIMEYKQLGYLSEAIVNFLALMGWAPGDNREILSRSDLIKEFSLKDVNKTSAIFNIDKLNWLNGQYIKEMDPGKLATVVMPILQEKNVINENFDREKLTNLVELYKTRVRTLVEFPTHLNPFYTKNLKREEEAVKKYLENDETRKNLVKWRRELSSVDPFVKDRIEDSCRKTAASLGIKPKELIHPTRVAISGTTTGAGLFEMMEIMGKETVFQRIDEATGSGAL
ncbi:MAG: glutamate--tRNA ligase [Candidatus Omnitrophica bacterium]|nr:glutamate--tRNA ligase [Candidatus Omnitrophota bacterium]